MATTTPNYGWTVPTSTDLVKDGATAIETLGDAVDATVFSNANAAIAKTIVDAKGDIIAATAADTVSRLAVGANNTVLTADSSTATGLKWAAAASGAKSYTLINTGGTALTGAATITVSGISGVDNLMIIVINASSASAGSDFTFRFNSDSGSNYIYGGMQQQKGSDFTKLASSVTGDSNIFFGVQGSNVSNSVCGYLQVLGAAGSGNKAFQTQAAGDGTSAYQTNSGGVYEGTSTISSVSIISGVGNFDAGTIYVYGA
jgi:hypothetical protein